MPSKNRILIVSRSPEAVTRLGDSLSRYGDLEIETNTLVNGHHDPLYGVTSLPDLLVLRVNENSVLELEELINSPADRRVPLIVVDGEQDSQSMRLAMQAGARDFLREPVVEAELHAAIDRILDERQASTQAAPSAVTTFINAKGGSGASVLATSFAHVCQVVRNQDTVIVDLDRQFAALPQYLDLAPSGSVFDALRVADELDSLALDGFVARHASGLGVMAGRQEEGSDVMAMGQHDSCEIAMGALLGLLIDRFERIVAEVPRHLDLFGAAMLRHSNEVIIVVQQTVPGIRDGARLKHILVGDLGVPPERITVLVNRYQPNLNTELADIRNALGVKDVFIVPNDFKTVTEAVDMGVPIYALSEKSPVASALVSLPGYLAGEEASPAKGFLSKSLSVLMRN